VRCSCCQAASTHADSPGNCRADALRSTMSTGSGTYKGSRLPRKGRLRSLTAARTQVSASQDVRLASCQSEGRGPCRSRRPHVAAPVESPASCRSTPGSPMPGGAGAENDSAGGRSFASERESEAKALQMSWSVSSLSGRSLVACPLSSAVDLSLVSGRSARCPSKTAHVFLLLCGRLFCRWRPRLDPSARTIGATRPRPPIS